MNLAAGYMTGSDDIVPSYLNPRPLYSFPILPAMTGRNRLWASIGTYKYA